MGPEGSKSPINPHNEFYFIPILQHDFLLAVGDRPQFHDYGLK